jgi:hypothetical protein
MKNLHWGNRDCAKSQRARAAGSLSKAGRAARAIGWQVKCERSQASAAAREAHLRSLMGLPAQRSAALDLDDEG